MKSAREPKGPEDFVGKVCPSLHKLEQFLHDSGLSQMPSDAIAERKDGVFMVPDHGSDSGAIDEAEQSVIVKINTGTKDRHGDIVQPSGALLGPFRKNPVVLFAHDYTGLPIAKSLWERVEDHSITAKARFHLNTQLSREVWTLVKARILSAWSIGFMPKAWRPNEDGDGFLVSAWELLEYSAVPVGANADALTERIAARSISAPCLLKALCANAHSPPPTPPAASVGVPSPVVKGTIVPSAGVHATGAGRAVGDDGGEHLTGAPASYVVAGQPVVRTHAGPLVVRACLDRAYKRALARLRGEGDGP